MASRSAKIVAGLTVAAVASVGYLAYQASASVPASLARTKASASPSVAKAPRVNKASTVLPGGSGTGERVVYSVGGDRVWLVDEDGAVRRTFTVTPGTVDPTPGHYRVTSRSNAVTGTDGTPIEHVVRFALLDGVPVGFSAATSGVPPQPVDPSVRTGGIRESRPDGEAMWRFATIGQHVVVIR
ncbi:hypothetical protein ACFYWX_07460 [Streptomyces sp. NPDC002888]|uniref:hypothetical protein n=1 Tax=Streptomyces sp. NPDC002888 TaxID=3364668 RepID=UPI0036A4656A